MDDAAYEKLATRAREALGARPRPTTVEAATQMLAEIAAEMEVPERLHRAFAERLRPAMVQIVATVRSKLIRDLEEAAARPYLGKPVNPRVVGQPDAKPVAISPTTPALTVAPEPVGDHAMIETQAPRASLAPERGEADQAGGEIHPNLVAPPAPQDDGQARADTHGRFAVPAERGDERGQADRETHQTPAALVTPLSLRVEVLDGWRALKDEPLYVPEFEDVTYGSASAIHRQRAMTYYHSVSRGYLDKARRMRALDEFVRSQGVDCLNDILESPALAGREP